MRSPFPRSNDCCTLLRVLKTLCISAAGITLFAVAAMATQTLDIYFIDVEGGQSTLIVTPRGESLLVDTGFAANGFDDTSNRGRDAQRIVAAVRAAGLKRNRLFVDHALSCRSRRRCNRCYGADPDRDIHRPRQRSSRSGAGRPRHTRSLPGLCGRTR